MNKVCIACYRAEDTSALHSFLSDLLCDQVFVYKTHGSSNCSFFQSPDSWLPVDTKKKRRHPEAQTSCLKDVMEFLLLGDPVAEVRFTLFLSRTCQFKTPVMATRCACRAKRHPEWKHC